jgi:hypothetical protein
MANWNAYATELEKLEQANRFAYEQYIKVSRNMGLDTLDSLKIDTSKKLLSMPENINKISALEARLEVLGQQFVEGIAADEAYVQAFKNGAPFAPPNTQLGRGCINAARLAQEVIGYTGLNTRMLIADRLNYAVGESKLLVGNMQQKFIDRFRQTTLTGGMPREMRKYLDTEFGFNKSQQITVTRGTYMGTYRGCNHEIAKEIGTEYFRHSGPPPLLGKDGHDLCINHIGETHSWDEWIEIGLSYGIGEMELKFWVGGYNCRHGWTPVPKHLVERAVSGDFDNREFFAAAREELEAMRKAA